MLRASTACRWLLAGAAFFSAAVGCEAADGPDPSALDVVLESTPDALGGTSTSAAFLSIKSVELVSCEDPGALRLDALLAIRIAQAHEMSSPTRLGVPALDDLSGAKVVTLGTLAPPSVAYCSVRVGFGPADADAVGMPADRAAVGRTLWIAGRTAEPVKEFKLTTSEVRTVELPVPRFRPGEHA